MSLKEPEFWAPEAGHIGLLAGFATGIMPVTSRPRPSSKADAEDTRFFKKEESSPEKYADPLPEVKIATCQGSQ